MLLFATSPDSDDERIVYHDKHNVSPMSPTQVYAVEPTTVRDDDQVIPTARLVYRRDVEVDVDQLFGRAGRDNSEASALEEATNFLAAELAFGPKLVVEVNRDAHGLGISISTLERARKRLGVESRRVGGIAGRGRWELHLPLSDTGHGDGRAPSSD
jgi:hypothetical protein